MIKKIAWDTFKNTGDINAYLELKQIEQIESQIQANELKLNLPMDERKEDSKNL